MPLTWLTICVAEDTYSSEETVDHQPVHLRVMDTADLVTVPPSLRQRISAASHVLTSPENPIPLGSSLLCGLNGALTFLGLNLSFAV